MSLGTVGLRAKPELKILRGTTPDEALQRSELAPCFDATEAAAIKSGMVVSLHLDNGVYKWKRGMIAGSTPYIAEWDGNDPRVTASGKLPAISMSGQFTLLTGYFNAADAALFVPEALVSAYAHNDGTESNRGKLKIAATTEYIVARGARGQVGSIDYGPGATDESWAVAQDSTASSGTMVAVDSAFTGAKAP